METNTSTRRDHSTHREAVYELIEAAGPLSLCDIAGGLAVSLRTAARRVREMFRQRQLERDEFGRFRLIGAGA